MVLVQWFVVVDSAHKGCQLGAAGGRVDAVDDV